MINFIFSKTFLLVLSIFDYSNKKKVINFFKKKFGKRAINLIDIGAHEGETMDLFLDNMNINKIYAFEPNLNIFRKISLKTKYNRENINIFNLGVGKYTENKILNVFSETSSSTLNSINEDTKYFKRKKKIISLFYKKSFLNEKQEVKICNLSEFIIQNKIENIDVLKIDTEGFEYNIISGIKNDHFEKIKFIYFEHHYDLMLKKNYKFSDINKILIKNNFILKLKLKMKFRKVFEYIYEKNN